MKLHLSLRTIALCILLLAGTNVYAQSEDEDTSAEGLVAVSPEQQLVAVEIHPDVLAAYKERRGNSGVYFGVNYEGIDLKNYLSTLDSSTYRTVFGESQIPLTRVLIEYKYNLSIGSLSGGIDYGMGTLSSNKSGTERSIKLSKYGVGLKFTADMFFDEPYVAPYLGINMWQMGINESSPTDSFSATTQMGYNYTVGFLLQLDWIDYSTAKEATFDWGLENTFIDIYATQYAKTSAAEDPNTETDLLYGAGLRLEF